jgi:aspartyl/asparaginyl-tRNA synthetase
MAKTKKKVNKYTDFVTDIAKAMERHDVKNLVVICGFEKEIRNTYIAANGEEDVYSMISDLVNEWMMEAGFPQKKNIEAIDLK